MLKVQSFTLITQNTNEIISLVDLKDYLRETTNDNDTRIINISKAIIEIVQSYINYTLLNTEFLVKLDGFSNYQLTSYNSLINNRVYIKKGKVHTISFVKYYDLENTLQTYNPSSYQLVQESPFSFITPLPITQMYPDTYYNYNSVQIQFISGFGVDNTSIPSDLIEAIKQHIKYIFDMGVPMCDINKSGIPSASQAIYNKYSLKDKLKVY